MKKRIGFIGLVIENREQSAPQVNQLLSSHATIIVARTGIPYHDRNCCVITLIVDATTDEIGDLTGRLGSLPGVTVKSALNKDNG